MQNFMADDYAFNNPYVQNAAVEFTQLIKQRSMKLRR